MRFLPNWIISDFTAFFTDDSTFLATPSMRATLSTIFSCRFEICLRDMDIGSGTAGLKGLQRHNLSVGAGPRYPDTVICLGCCDTGTVRTVAVVVLGVVVVVNPVPAIKIIGVRANESHWVWLESRAVQSI